MDVEDFQQAIDTEFETLEGFLKQLRKKGISDSKREEVSMNLNSCAARQYLGGREGVNDDCRRRGEG